MNIKKVEKAAKKINQLLDNIKDEGHVSNIEKDLLLSYIRDMYDKVLDANTDQNKEERKKDERKKENKIDPIYTPPVNPPEDIKYETRKEDSPIQIADVVRQEIQNTQSDYTPNVAPMRDISQAYAPDTNTDLPDSAAEVIEEQRPEAPAELLALFEANTISELSDKLSRSPITDLTKCMGINERIFTVNELFGGDTGLFNTTMQSLNSLQSIEQARDYLVTHVALDNDWAESSKIKKAANFVKLISRKY